LNLEVITDAYLRYQAKRDRSDQWAWDAVESLINRDPDEAWKISCMLVNKASSDEALAFVAAGPLEDLLKKHGSKVIERVEAESTSNPRLQLALSGVWGIEPADPIFERWYALMCLYGFAEGKRSSL
jgi:hypothetical protein